MADDTDEPDSPTPGSGDGEATPAAADGDAAAAASEAPPRRRRSKLKITLLTLLTMLVIVVLAAGGFALYLNHLLDSNVKHAGLLPTNAPDSAPTRQAEAGDAQNILLLGSDSRDTSDIHDASRADVIQLVHISKGHKSIQVIHFPRDLFVSIPGHGKNKINAAYAFGGAPLLVTTLQNMLGVHIDHVAQIGFTGFAKVTDELGGVDVYVSQPFDEKGYGTFSKGWNHMNGEQALGFVRERHQLREGDIDRGRDQQAWIKAVLKKTLKTSTLINPVKLSNIIEDITANTVVDNEMTTSYMRGTALKLRNIRMKDVTFFTAPFDGFSSVKGVGSIDVVDEPQMKKLGKALAKDRMADYTHGRNQLK